MTESRPSIQPVPNRDVALMTATAGLLVLVLLHALVGFTPTLHFDMDPRSVMGGAANIFIGPAGSMVLNVFGVLWAAGALAAHAAVGGRMRWGSAALVALGCAACAAHFTEHIESLWRGGHWFAAACLALAMLHLAEHPRPRRLIAAALIALLVPLLIAALHFVLVEHAATMQTYLANRDEFLRARGIAPGSAEQLLFERRMSFNDVVGVFGLSNVYGSILAGWAVLAVALAAGHLLGRRRGRAALAATLAGAGLACVYLSASKGAAVAAAAGVGVAVVASLPWMRLRQRVTLPVLAMALVAAALAVVVLRGLAGPPETHAGERSLLFRWHYWQAAGGALAEASPRQWAVGVGAGPFHQDLYFRHKNPLNPEDVQSVHSVFIDYITLLGAGGAAWSLLLLGWLWLAGRRLAEEPPAELAPVKLMKKRDNASPLEIDGGQVAWACAVALPLFAAQLFFKHEVLLAAPMFYWWIGGAGAFVALAAVLADEAMTLPRCVRVGLFAAAVVLLTHGQIEMTFFHHGAVVIAWSVVAAAAARNHQPAAVPPRRRWLLPIALLLAGLGLLPGTTALWRQQGQVVDAAAALREGRLPEAVGHLDSAIAALPIDPLVYRAQADLRLERALMLGSRRRTDAARAEVDAALAQLEKGRGHLTDVSLLHRQARLQAVAADLLNEPHRLHRAAELTLEVLQRQPYSLSAHLHAAELFRRLGDRARARELYQRCLNLSDMAYLDPAKQLSAQDLAHVRARLAELEGGGG